MFNKRVESAVQTCPDRGSTPLSSTKYFGGKDLYFSAVFTFFGVIIKSRVKIEKIFEKLLTIVE